MEVIFIRLKYIKEFNESDRRALTAIAKTSIATEQQLKKIITKNRIYSYIKEGILKKDMYYNPAKSIQAYRLTQHGQKIATYYFNIKDFQHSESIIHDIIIANKYFSLSYKEQETWLSETTIKKILKEKEDEFEEGKNGALDGVYNEEISQLKLGYAITIFKSQGSEFKAVIIVADDDNIDMYNNRLLYVSVTRAKEKVVIISESENFKKAVENKGKVRNEYLLERVQS